MMIDITSAYIADGIVTIEGIDSSEENLMRMERTRDDGFERTVSFVFDTRDRKTFKYLYNFLHQQKSVQAAHPVNYGDAIHALIGIRTSISGRYLSVPY
ncbi:MAG: hypothetical protein LUC32_06065 [Clostridiales bacterium]|nr:hypothetical protein [Clostridiales bacterium]